MRRQVPARPRLLLAIGGAAVAIATCGGEAAPQPTKAATREPAGPTDQAAAPASTTAVPVDTPGNGDAGVGDAAVRRAWDGAEITMSMTTEPEATERIAELWALVPQNLPIPEQCFDLETASGIGFGWADCHGGKHPSFGAYWKDESRFGQPAALEEVLDWYLAEGTAAGWDVAASPCLNQWTGEEYGTFLRFTGFGDVWNVVATQDYGVNLTCCPAAR